MKIITYLFLSLLLIINSINAREIKTFYWIDDEDYPPLIFLNSNGKPAGIFYQIMRKAFHKLKIPLKVELYPWARAQKLIK